MPVKQVYITISGRVQGVGFRYYALHKAEELNITGWIKNTPEGNVEMEASGETKNLDVFIEWMKIGPSRAYIERFAVSEISPKRTFTHFIIR
jgi:acylphosphatase